MPSIVEVVIRNGLLFAAREPEADFRRYPGVSLSLQLFQCRCNTFFARSDLEKAVEELSQMLEEEVEDETVKALRQRTVDKTVRHLRVHDAREELKEACASSCVLQVYVRGRHEILLKDTAAGLAEGRWEWNITL